MQRQGTGRDVEKAAWVPRVLVWRGPVARPQETAAQHLVLTAAQAELLFARAQAAAASDHRWDVGGAALSVFAHPPAEEPRPRLVASGYMRWDAFRDGSCLFIWRPVPGGEQEAEQALARLCRGIVPSRTW